MNQIHKGKFLPRRGCKKKNPPCRFEHDEFLNNKRAIHCGEHATIRAYDQHTGKRNGYESTLSDYHPVTIQGVTYNKNKAENLSYQVIHQVHYNHSETEREVIS